MTSTSTIDDSTRTAEKHVAVLIDLLKSTASSWQDDAACRTHPNPDLWFAAEDNPVDAQLAASICHECPVRAQCEDHANAYEKWGMWAAISQRARNRRRSPERREAISTL